MMAESDSKHHYPNSPPPYNPQTMNMPQPQTMNIPQPINCYPQPQVQQMVYAQQVPNPQVQVTNPHAHQGYIAVAAHPQLVVAPSVGPSPARVTCPSCHNQIVTRTETVNSSKTHTWAAILCILGCWPCCLIPYCMDDCMSTNHYCSQCNAYIGRYES